MEGADTAHDMVTSNPRMTEQARDVNHTCKQRKETKATMSFLYKPTRRYRIDPNTRLFPKIKLPRQGVVLDSSTSASREAEAGTAPLP